MVLSYPQIFPYLGDWLPKGSLQLRAVWGLMGIGALAVLAYSGSQFFVGAREALRHRQANMHTLIAIGTGVAWVYSTVALVAPGIFPAEKLTDVYYDVTVVDGRSGAREELASSRSRSWLPLTGAFVAGIGVAHSLRRSSTRGRGSGR